MQGWQPAVATAPTPAPDIVEIDLELAIPGVVSLYVFLQAGQIVVVARGTDLGVARLQLRRPREDRKAQAETTLMAEAVRGYPYESVDRPAV